MAGTLEKGFYKGCVGEERSGGLPALARRIFRNRACMNRHDFCNRSKAALLAST
jgi:hypothetical protein